MKLLRAEKDRFVFRLAPPEKEVLALLLRLYPVIPPAHQQLSKSTASVNDANQQLLDEALAEQRKENKDMVDSFLADPKRFKDNEASVRMTVTPADVEWLLQILNDVRVGNWILLGSPEEGERPEILPNDPNAPRLGAMEMAAFFQMHLLRALNQPPTDELPKPAQ